MLTHDIIPAADPDSRRLMICLHGLGDSMEGYRWVPHVLNRPDLNYLLVNAPDPYLDGYSWYDIHGDSRPGVLRGRELLAELFAALADRGFPPHLTCLFGFSQGCLMTIDAGFRRHPPLAGLIGISGHVFEPDALLADLPRLADGEKRPKLLFTHGRRDPLIPLGPVRESVGRLRDGGLDIDWREFDKEHMISQEELPVIAGFLESLFSEDAKNGSSL